jgi:ribosomal protein L11 methyltransferase
MRDFFMNSYIELQIGPIDQQTMELLIARLAEIGYDGFLEEEQTLKAYINASLFDAPLVDHLKADIGFTHSIRLIREENWNALWESSFEPVIIDDYVAIRADFHKVVKNVKHEIIITPKMSFGTGHHATTFLVISEMRHWDWLNKSVLDFGTGTGILAVLAAKEGASSVLAIDNDPWSIENATENIARNKAENIHLALSGEIPPRMGFDIIIANINRHILLEHAQSLCHSLHTGGVLLLSGILKEDLDLMESAFIGLGKPIRVTEKNNWLLISFMK